MKAFEVELHHNLMAGCEKMIFDQRKKEEQEAKKAERDTAKGNQQKEKEKAKKSAATSKATFKVKKTSGTKKAKPKTKAKVRKPNPYRAGYLNDLSSLVNHDIYSVANANLSKKKLATTDATRKKDALAGLLAGIDNGDIASARREKNHIDRSTKVLGIRKVRADGEGGWKLKGDSSRSQLITNRF